jgi:HEAT repeat protein
MVRLFRSGLLLSLITFLTTAPSARALEEVIDSAMDRNPNLPMPKQVTVFDERLKPLWLDALARPEADFQCQAALSIALAHRRGMKGLETTIAPLLEALDRPGQRLNVRLAVARALITLDARQAAEQLFRQAQSGEEELRYLIEPALARWNHKPARTVWLARLNDQESPRGSLLLAIRGLAEIQEAQAAPQLRELVLSRHTPAPVRLEAARALGLLCKSGSEKDAQTLVADATPSGLVGRLAAASLLQQHSSDEAVRLLQKLAGDDEPAVAVLALGRLVEMDRKLVLPVLRHALASADAVVRSIAVEVLFRLPTQEHIVLLGGHLDDPHPEVRLKARTRLRELGAKPEHREAALRQGTRLLAADGWRGQEQATILLAQLGHKPAAARLVALLKADRPEVFITAAWALGKLSVADSLPAVLDRVRYDWDLLVSGRKDVPTEAIRQQLSQLVQCLGQARYQPAEAALAAFIPKTLRPLAPHPVGPEPRAAALWALGLLHEGQPTSRLVAALEDRLTDRETRPPEDGRVRQMAAVSLGRMKAHSALASLRKSYWAKKPARDPVNNACGWAIQQLTGEAMPPAGTETVSAGSWFLSPID